MSNPGSVHSSSGQVSLRHEGTRGLYLGSARALIYSHVSIELLRKQLFHQLGEELARSIIAQAGHHGGFNDAQLLLQEEQFDSVESMLRAQYDRLAEGGFGTFDIIDLSVDRAAGDAYVRAVCGGSSEADSHKRLFGTAEAPACCHLVGYSSGWATAMTGLQLLTVETHCVAKGDDRCEFESLPYQDFVGQQAAFWKRAFESTSTSLAQELEEKLSTIHRQVETIQEQQDAINKLSAPILQVGRGLLVLPVIGAVDDGRAQMMSEKLLPSIAEHRARGIIIDVTGVESLDTSTAYHLIRMARAASLLGSSVVLTGISPATAQILVSQGVELPDIATRRSLHDGIRHLETQGGRGR